jgi:putative two-component system response regulator
VECKRLGLIVVKDYDIDEYIKDINYTSVLHDIGKMAIPSTILEKDGLLTEDERVLVRKHPIIGANYIKRIIDIFEDDPIYSSYINFLRIPYEICRHHHEHWDGSGYPDGLTGEAIPIPARIISVVDTYEAIRGKRAYIHTQKSHEETVKIIASEAGRQFDPKMVEAFLNVNYRFADMHSGQ